MTAPLSSYAILVVEDNQDIVVGVQDLLQHDGYQVDVAETCARAIELARARRYNAVLLDLTLPDGDGIEVLKTIRDLDPNLPVIIVTASTSTEKTVGSLTRGAFAYMTKPYHREELRQTLRRAIGVKELTVKVAQAEGLLSESEERFRSLVESAADAIVVADGHGTIISWNRSASNLFGYTDAEAIDRPFTLLMPERYRSHHERELARMEATGEGRVIGSVVELHGLKKDGTEFPIELSLATWKVAAEQFYSGIIRDCSERKRAEASLQQLSHRYSLILNQAGQGIYGLNIQGHTTFANPSAAAMLGYPADELLGRPMHDLLHHSRPDGTTYPKEECPIYTVLCDGVTRRVDDDTFWRKDGTSFSVEYVSTAIVEQGAVTGAVVVFRDITEQREAARAVREGQERFRQLAEHVREVFWITDPTKQHMLYISPGYEEIWGRSCESLYASPQSWLDAIHPDDRARVLDAVTHKQAIGTYEEQYRILRPDGAIRWICDRAFPIRDASGVVYRIVGFAEDITDHKCALESLRASEERLEFVTRGSSDGFWDRQVLPNEPWHSPRTPVWWSPRVRDMLGYSMEEFPDVLESWTSRLHPGDRARVYAALEAHIERREPYDVEYRLLTKQEQYQWFRARGQAIWDQSGRVTRMAGSLQCISDRKHADEALRRSEQLLHDIVNHTTAVIYVKYANGRYLLTNRRYEQLFNLTRDQIVGRTDHEIFPSEIADVFRANDVRVLEQNAPEEYEEQAPHPDGLHTYLSIKFPLRDETGAPYALCGISSDITQRKQAEDRLRSGEEPVGIERVVAQVGVWTWDLQADRFYWSPRVDALLGTVANSGSGNQYDLLGRIYPEDRTKTRLALRRALDQPHKPVRLEHRVVWPDGTHHWLVWAGHIVCDQTGSPVYGLGTVHEGIPPHT